MKMIIQGDCIEEMKKLEDNSIDAIITDPPYGLAFMGKKWDNMDNLEFQKFTKRWASACWDALKPGGFLLSFGGTRTYHRMVCGIEDAGFEIRDTIMWLYGSGFPKSLNIGKQIDKIQGVQGEKIGEGKREQHEAGNYGLKNKCPKCGKSKFSGNPCVCPKPKVITPEAKEWEGWGTALKPAVEPIVVARKPLSEKNVALNVLKWGTGGINIDESRIGNEERTYGIKGGENLNKLSRPTGNDKEDSKGIGAYGQGAKQVTIGEKTVQGRFPANIILNEEAGKMLDGQTGELKSGSGAIKKATAKGYQGNDYGVESRPAGTKMISHADKGGASRFFYCAKASKSERNFGMGDKQPIEYEDKKAGIRSETSGQHITRRDGGDPKSTKNNHPTVKPIKLMEYLIKLVSKEGATILDPFVGSGTTGIASIKLNRKFIGIEKEEEYVKIAQARIKPFLEQRKLSQ